MSIFVLVICFRICFNVWGVWILGFRVGWLCTHMIDVSAGSTYW